MILKAIILIVLGAVFPLLYLFLPSIFLAESLKTNIFKAMSLFLSCCFLVAIFISIEMGLIIFAIFAPLILIYDYLIKNKFEVTTSVVVGAVIFFISMGVVLYNGELTTHLLNAEENIKLFSNIQKEMSGNDLIKNIGMANLVIIYNRTIQMLPSFLVMISLIMSYSTYLFTGRILLKQGILINQPPSFVFLKIPKGIFGTFIISSMLIYLFEENIGFSYSLVINNILTVLNAILFFVGLSNLHFALLKLKARSLAKICLTVGAFLIPMVSTILVIVGLLDTVFNFRKLPE